MLPVFLFSFYMWLNSYYDTSTINNKFLSGQFIVILSTNIAIKKPADAGLVIMPVQGQVLSLRVCSQA